MSTPNQSDDRLSRRSVLKASALALGGLATTGTTTTQQRGAINTVVDHVPFFVVDEAGNPAPFDDHVTPLYEGKTYETRLGAGQAPIEVRAPNGNHVTWGEFTEVTGKAEVLCVEEGTRTTVHVDGLIPNGLYTVWNLVVDAPGFDGTLESIAANAAGDNPLGANTGTQNEFRASPTGHGYVSAITPAGSMLRNPPDYADTRPMEACALDEFDYHVLGAYHLDDRTHGEIVGPPETEVVQFGWQFQNE